MKQPSVTPPVIKTKAFKASFYFSLNFSRLGNKTEAEEDDFEATW